MEGGQLLQLLGQDDAEDVLFLVQRPASHIAHALYDRLTEDAAQRWTPIHPQNGEDDVVGELLMEGGQLLQLLREEDAEDVLLRCVQRPASPIVHALHDRLASHPDDNGCEGCLPLEKACGEPVLEAHTLGINLGPLQHQLNSRMQLAAARATENERRLKEEQLVQGISEKVGTI